MGAGQEWAKVLEQALLKDVHGCTNTRVLCDDVLDAASEIEIVQLAGRSFEISDMKVAERPHAQPLCCSFAAPSTVSVRTRCKRMADLGIDQEQDVAARSRVKRDLPKIEVARVDEKDVAGSAEESSQLVHCAARNADKLSLGFLACEC